MENDMTIVPNQAELERQFEFVNSLIERHRSTAIALVNAEAIQMYWDIGQYISLQLQSARWGANVVGDLADYLKRQNPKRRGFGKRHLYNMVRFYDTYSSESFYQIFNSLQIPEFVQSGIAQLEAEAKPLPNLLTIIPFTGHIEIMNRCRIHQRDGSSMLQTN